MKIYIAGPYTSDPEKNTENAIHVGDSIETTLGHTVHIPHLTHYWHKLCPHEYEFWMRHDAEWLKCCDALLRLPGASDGADSEVELAYQLGKKVYYSVWDIPCEVHHEQTTS